MSNMSGQDVIGFMILHHELNAHQLASQSVAAGNDLWREMRKGGLYERAFRCPNYVDMDHAFLCAIARKDLEVVNEFVRTAFHGYKAEILNQWFYSTFEADSEESVSMQIAELAQCNELGEHLHPRSLEIAFIALEEFGLDLTVSKAIAGYEPDQIDNGLQDVFKVAVAYRPDKQTDLMDVADVYLSMGLTMYESTRGISESPLAILLKAREVETVAAWSDMLINGGYILPEHVRACGEIAGVKAESVALLDAHFARKQIQGISYAALAKAVRP